MKAETICVLGGTGFVGRHLVSRLVELGYMVRVPTRHRERHRGLLVLPGIEMVEGDCRDEATQLQWFSGCRAVVNLVGILNERRRGDFSTMHADLPRQVASSCLKAGVPRLLHMSALNADASLGASRYLRSKGVGEDVAFASHGPRLAVTSFRPSVIFGPGDSFFNRFAALLRLSPPVFPLIAGASRMAPLYVGDLVEAMVVALANKATEGLRYDLCGPRAVTLRQVVEYTAEVIGKPRFFIDVPPSLAGLLARVAERLPGPIITTDNLASLSVPSVCAGPFPAVFQLTPKTIEAVVPSYLGTAGVRMRYDDLRRKARHEY